MERSNASNGKDGKILQIGTWKFQVPCGKIQVEECFASMFESSMLRGKRIVFA
jgi:hypothetical protein